MPILAAALPFGGLARSALAVAPTRWTIERSKLNDQDQFTRIPGVVISRWKWGGALQYKTKVAQRLATVQVLAVTRDSPTTVPIRRRIPAGKWQLLLRNGDAIIGSPVAIKGADLIFNCASGALHAPLQLVAALRRMADVRVPAVPADHDTVVMRDGERLAGTLDAMSAGHIRFTSKLGPASLSFDRVRGLVLGGLPMKIKPGKLVAHVVLTDGTRFLVSAFAWGKQYLATTDPAGKPMRCPIADIARIGMRGGDAVFLSNLKPIAYAQNSTFGSLRWPLGRNRAVTGGPLMVDKTRYLHGLGVHVSTDTLRYRVPAGYAALFVTPAMDDSAAPWGQASVTILAGKHVLYRGLLRAGQKAQPLVLPLGTHRTVTFRVAAAGHLDVLGRVDLLHAVLLRAASVPPPTAAATQ